MSTAPTLPPLSLPYPWDYAYEWDGSMGARKFSPSARNGRKPDRSVPVFTEEQVRSVATEHASALAQRVEELARWKSTHAPRLEAVEWLYHTAQHEATLGRVAVASLASEREANAMLTARVEELERDLAAMATAHAVAVELGATYAARVDVAADEVGRLRGESAVLIGLLTDCAAVLRTIDPSDSDEAEKLAALLTAIDRAQAPSRHKGALL